MAAIQDPILDPGGSVLLNLMVQPKKKTRRTFLTDSERKEAQAEVKRKSAQRRIHLGDLWDEWEQQRMLCGITDTREFVAHLLAVHAGRCPQLEHVTTSLHAISSDNEVECVPETPKNKRKGEPIDDSFESPIIPVYKKVGSTYDSKLSGSLGLSNIATSNQSLSQSASTSTSQGPTSGSLSVPDIATSTQSASPSACTSTSQGPTSELQKETSPGRVGSTCNSTLSGSLSVPDFATSACTSTSQGPPSELHQQTPPRRENKARRALLCSTPISSDKNTGTVVPEEEMAILTPIKKSGSTRRTRRVVDPELPHTPKMFADGSEWDDDRPADKFKHDAMDFDSCSEDDEEIEIPTTNWRDLRMTMGTDDAIEARKCIAFNDVLEKLVRVAVGEHCRRETCRKPLVFKQVKRGTCLLVSWNCPDKAKGERHFSGVWSSQPRVHGMDGGNLTTSTALTLSGNNFAKVALMAKFMKLHFVSQQDHNCIQSRYIAPAVNHYWESMQARLLSEVTRPLVIAGDGRNDSPGHCATFLTYSFMDFETKKILAMAVVDCLDTALNSVVMERVGFQRAMEQILAKAGVAEVITDAHPQIRKIMRTDERYKYMLHQWDLWHSGKGLSGRLLTAGKERGMSEIIPWIPAIKNHLWHSSKTCGGDADKLRMTWQTVLYHICNRHEWVDTTGLTSGQCAHDPLTDQPGDKAWIKPGTKVQERLIQVIRNKTFVKNLSYLTNFRHTGELEQFHSHLLMYAPKRIAFRRPYYEMRCQLAIIDYNEHLDRPYAEDKNGKQRLKSNWGKATKRWTPVPMKVPKRYAYMNALMAKVLNIRMSEAAQGIPLSTPVYRECMDPQKRPQNIAAVPRPPQSVMLSRLQRRF